MDYVDYWDNQKGEQMRRPCTAAEQAELDARRAAAQEPTEE